jgi:hypothetical protein
MFMLDIVQGPQVHLILTTFREVAILPFSDDCVSGRSVCRKYLRKVNNEQHTKE